MAFTTWQNLYDQMLDDLASGNWKTNSYSIGNRSLTYTSFNAFRNALEYVKSMAGIEAGTTSFRVYAKQGGRAS